jgi:hypothetical protein
MEPSRQQEHRPQPEVLSGFPERPELPECVTPSSYAPGCLHFWSHGKKGSVHVQQPNTSQTVHLRCRQSFSGKVLLDVEEFFHTTIISHMSCSQIHRPKRSSIRTKINRHYVSSGLDSRLSSEISEMTRLLLFGTAPTENTRKQVYGLEQNRQHPMINTWSSAPFDGTSVRLLRAQLTLVGRGHQRRR